MKYRRKILVKQEHIQYFCHLTKGIAQRYEFEIEEVGSDGDHVHILVFAPPRFSPSKIMQIVKSITSRMIFKKFPEIKKQLWGGELWSDGGFVGTIGQTLSLDNMRKYIKRQGSKSKNYTLKKYLTLG